MPWSDLAAELDTAVFAALADDTAATWSRTDAVVATLPVILEQVERPSRQAGMTLIEMADVARISVAAAEAAAPGVSPRDGDTLLVGARLLVIHGQPWRDDRMDRRDWLCPVTG
ncbi:hypothetical protein KOAAANKH_00101 [Brevundimonas sp. NIBR10]|uniref:head-tail joining protein n=1 Tax=Brevundimonas sp. NIBR10 TaxID=3015997 RepID=UPI0022F171F6|nr:hypothetical protein [Brevundimonas sp. NIBR10]WGM45240.1 hypothetical protein KOAAANKH_00101 [Brevundimonas sp. NIBR10]